MGVLHRKSRLAYWRRLRGLTQQDLARMMNVSSATIGNWELDNTLPTSAQVRKLAIVLRVHVRELFPFMMFW